MFLDESFPLADLEIILENTPTVILPDRNIVTRMASVAQNGLKRRDKPTEAAICLMAVAQVVNWDIEPSVAFHELAYRKNNDTAYQELSWFRVADKNQPQAWLNLALGRCDKLSFSEPIQEDQQDLTKPLERWRKNYVATLKMAELELDEKPSLEKFISFLDWMIDSFFVAGPAAMYAAMYFAPNSLSAGMLKKLRSNKREKAIAGIKNAAWDITYLSDFVKRAKQTQKNNIWTILATADSSLKATADGLMMDGDVSRLQNKFSTFFQRWWSIKDSEIVGSKLAEVLACANNREPPGRDNISSDPIGDFIKEGEEKILQWDNGTL